MVLAAAPEIFRGQVLRWSIDWLPTLGLTFGFRMDGLAWVFALLICAIGALVVLYAAYYLHADDPAARFFRYLLLFMGAMLGLVLADNLLLLVVYWEATSLASFLLIGYWNHREDAREGARMALTITGAGGLALLGGVLLLGHIVGSFQLDAVLAAGDAIRAHPLYVPALVLVLLGAFTKSAQFPFHFWLPHAMAAPTPVSAYLHSATMVKAGVFLLARLYPALGHSDAWFWLVSLTGLSTLLVGAYLAIFQHDLKGLLAYSTISHLGLITLLFGLDDALAVVAGVFHILNHATFKASLFMAAGIIDHETGSRDMRRLNGLWKYMPWTGALAMVASAAMAGVPLLNGFLSKEMFFGATVATEGPRPVCPGAAGGRDDRGHLQRRLQRALHPRRVLQRRAGRADAHAARAAALHARSGRDPGGDLPWRRHRSGADGRPAAGGRGRGRTGRAAARVQPGAVARVQPAAADVRDRAGGRSGALLRAAAIRQPAPRHVAAARRARGIPIRRRARDRRGARADARAAERQPAAVPADAGAGRHRRRRVAVPARQLRSVRRRR